ERLGEVQAVGDLEAERVDIGDEHQEAGKFLAARYDAELRGLLDRVDGVAAGIGKTDDLGLGGLRLQQERGEIGGVERMANATHHLAAEFGESLSGVTLQRRAERIVGREEEP